jgi:hypothetical protein
VEVVADTVEIVEVVVVDMVKRKATETAIEAKEVIEEIVVVMAIEKNHIQVRNHSQVKNHFLKAAAQLVVAIESQTLAEKNVLVNKCNSRMN